MSNEWKLFRGRLEQEGVLFCDSDAAKIARVDRQNRAYWSHLQRLMRMIQKKDAAFFANAETEPEQILRHLFTVTKTKNSVVYELGELLEVLYEIDRLVEPFDFTAGSTSAYAKRVKEALERAKEVYAWRVGENKEDFEPKYRIGRAPEIPRPPTSDSSP